MSTKQNNVTFDDPYRETVTKLIAKFFKPISANNVYLLTTLESRFQDLATEAGIIQPELFTSQNLKKKIVQ